MAAANDVLILSDAQIRAVLSAREVVDTQDRAFLLAADGDRVRSAQTAYATFAPDGFAFVHGAMADGETGVVFKTGIQQPGNAERGLPTVYATVTVHDSSSGRPVGVLNGGTVTALRTAGGLVSAARALGARHPHTVGVLGAGAQAREFVRLMAEVLPVERFLMWSPRPTAAGRDHLGAGLADLPVEIAASPRDLCERSRTIATCTLSRLPVVEGAWLRAGTTVLTVGSYAPDRSEIDVACSARAGLTVTDLPAKALAVNGPVRAAVRAGALAPDAVLPLADVLRGDHPGRAGGEETVVFHSNGLGIQDAVLAWRAYTLARAEGIGTPVGL